MAAATAASSGPESSQHSSSPFSCLWSVFVPNEWVELYSAKKYDRTQRMGRGLPNGQGTIVPSSWVQDDPTAGYKTHEKRHQNDVDILI